MLLTDDQLADAIALNESNMLTNGNVPDFEPRILSKEQTWLDAGGYRIYGKMCSIKTLFVIYNAKVNLEFDFVLMYCDRNIIRYYCNKLGRHIDTSPLTSATKPRVNKCWKSKRKELSFEPASYY